MLLNNFNVENTSGDYKVIHQEIHNVIEDLDEKIDGMIVKHEKDFMAAYRVNSYISFSVSF